MAHAHRIALLELMAQGEGSVEGLAERRGRTIANASQHLQQLRRAGLVATRREQKFVFYRLADAAVLKALSCLRQLGERNVAEVARIVRSYFNERDALEPVTRVELNERVKKGLVTVLDGRPAEEFRQGHVPGAQNVPLNQLERVLARLDRNSESLRIVGVHTASLPSRRWRMRSRVQGAPIARWIPAMARCRSSDTNRDCVVKWTLLGIAMKLYYTPGTSSLFPHIALREAGVAFKTVKVDEHTKLTEDGQDYKAVNPLGYVPALELDDGTVLTEGVSIAQFIADQVPAKQLAPPGGSLARAKLQMWLNFIASELQVGCFCRLFQASTSDAAKAMYRERLAARLAHLDRHLAQNQYLLGDQFSLADAYLYVVLNWSRPANVDLSPSPRVLVHRKRVGARPAVRAALKAEGLG